ncbi:MAG: hypothetical protein LUE20_00470 [Oscillospiraceae bacterium]|nr:hypothetical protein [Oscillospiraceae bacterium]
MPPYAQMTIRGRGGALPRYSGGDEVYVSGRGVSARYDYQSDKAIRIQAQANQDALRRRNIGPDLIKFGQTVNMWENNYAKTKAQDLFTQYERAMNELLEGENGLLTMKGERAFGTPEANGVPGTACSGGSCKQVYTVGPTEETDPSTFGLPATATASTSTGQPPLNPGDPDAIQQIGRARNPIPGSFGQAFFRQQNIQTGRRCVSGSCSGINNIRATRANSLRSQLLDGQYWHVRNIFNRLADDYDAKADLRVRKYQTAQFNKWQDDVDDASISQYLERAAANADNPEEFIDSLNKAKYYAKNKMERSGMAAPLIEENLKSMTSAAYRDAAINMIDNGNFAGAEALMNGNANYSLAYGRTEEGNIEKVSGAPQDSSPVRTVTIPTEKGYTIVPSVDSSGQPVTTDGAIEQYQTSGKNYGSYASEDAARLATRQLVMGSDVMNPKDKQRVLKNLKEGKAKKEVADKDEQFQMQTAVEDQMLAMSRGEEIPEGVRLDEAYFVAAYGDTVTARKKYEEYKQYIDAQPMIADHANLYMSSYDMREQLRQYKGGHKDTHGEGVAKLIETDIERREKALKDDPAQYMIDNFPGARELFAAATSGNGGEQAINEFVKLRDAFNQQYRQSNTDIQTSLFPKTYVQSQCLGITGGDTPEARVQTLRNIRDTLGPRGWEAFKQQARAEGHIPSGVDPVLELDPNDPEQLRAIEICMMANFDKGWRKDAEAILETKKAEIDKEVQAAFKPFGNSITVAGAPYAAELQRVGRDLTLGYMLEGSGSKEAAAKAYEMLVGTTSQMITVGDQGTIRVPRATYEAYPKIKDGLTQLQQNLLSGKENSLIHPDDVAIIQNARQQNYWGLGHDTLSSNLRMVTAQGENGVVLLDATTGRTLRGIDGLPLTYTWEDVNGYALSGEYDKQVASAEALLRSADYKGTSFDRWVSQNEALLSNKEAAREAWGNWQKERNAPKEVRVDEQPKIDRNEELRGFARNIFTGVENFGGDIHAMTKEEFMDATRYMLPLEPRRTWLERRGERRALTDEDREKMWEMRDKIFSELDAQREARYNETVAREAEEQRIAANNTREYVDYAKREFKQDYKEWIETQMRHGATFAKAVSEIRFREFNEYHMPETKIYNEISYHPTPIDRELLRKEMIADLGADMIQEDVLPRIDYEESGGAVFAVTANRKQVEKTHNELVKILSSDISTARKKQAIRLLAGFEDISEEQLDKYIVDFKKANRIK